MFEYLIGALVGLIYLIAFEMFLLKKMRDEENEYIKKLHENNDI